MFSKAAQHGQKKGRPGLGRVTRKGARVRSRQGALFEANRPRGATVRNPPACLLIFTALASWSGHWRPAWPSDPWRSLGTQSPLARHLPDGPPLGTHRAHGSP